MMRTIKHERGQVAIITAVTIFLLLLMVGLVVDLGYLFTRKTELQNAADAAALAGAKELNGTATGIDNAVSKAIALAAANNIDFGGDPIVIGSGEIEFGPHPNGPWSDAAIAKSTPRDKRFIRVDTSGILQGGHPTWFMRIAGFDSTTTYGMAVAGARTVDVLPIAACALDGSDGITPQNACKTDDCGYEKGKAYKLSEINPIGPGTSYWIDSTATKAGECDGSTPASLPFLCVGKISAAVAFAPQVFTNTGVSDPQRKAIDSRFEDYDASAKCDPTTAPPDLNIQEYKYDNTNVAAWMNPTPLAYVSPSFGDTCKPSQGECQASRVVSKIGSPPVIATDYGGVVWSFVRPEDSHTLTGRLATGSYPASGTPYANRDTTSGFYDAPDTHPGAPNRRVLNMLIVACPAPGGNCRPANVVGTAEFLLQKKTSTPGDKDIYIEYGGTVFGGISSDIALFR